MRYIYQPILQFDKNTIQTTHNSNTISLEVNYMYEVWQADKRKYQFADILTLLLIRFWT